MTKDMMDALATTPEEAQANWNRYQALQMKW